MKLLPSPLVCRDAVELVSDYLDGTLSRRQRRRLEKHLAQCDACSAYLDQMRATIAASGTVGPEDSRARSSRPRQPVPSIPSRRVKGPHGFV